MLDQLAQYLEDQGHQRQAVLVRSNFGGIYALHLIADAVYTERLPADLLRDLVPKLKQEELIAIGNERNLFRRGKAPTRRLQVTIERKLDLDTFREYLQSSRQLELLCQEAERVVFTEVEQLSDEELIAAYQDQLTAEVSSFNWYSRRLKQRAERMERLLTLNAPSVILAKGGELLSELVTNHLPNLNQYLNIYNQIKLNFAESESFEPDTEGRELPELKPNLIAAMKEEISKLISTSRAVLSDEQRMKVEFNEYLDRESKTREEDCLARAKEVIQDAAQGIIGSYDDESLELLSPDADDSNTTPKDPRPFHEILYRSSLETKKDCLATFEYANQKLSDKLAGLQQIVEGGPITNPKAHPTSTLQNHAKYPNIEYSEETRERVATLVDQMEVIRAGLPDISDLAAPSRLRKASSLDYEMHELEKDPWDVKFGNDSGSCIFVPTSIKGLTNGVFVPLYLIHPSIRLFAIGRRAASFKRMGLVMAFDMNEGPLACNSVELSRFGMVGGNKTVTEVSRFAEDWMAEYQHLNGYQGATMGAHRYNTSANHSTRRGPLVVEELTFQTPIKFYSDILVAGEEGQMKLRPQGSYWLTK